MAIVVAGFKIILPRELATFCLLCIDVENVEVGIIVVSHVWRDLALALVHDGHLWLLQGLLVLPLFLFPFLFILFFFIGLWLEQVLLAKFTFRPGEVEHICSIRERLVTTITDSMRSVGSMGCILHMHTHPTPSICAFSVVLHVLLVEVVKLLVKGWVLLPDLISVGIDFLELPREVW